VVLLPEQDVPDLLPRALQPLAIERLLGLELEHVIAERGAVRPRDLAGPQAEDLVLDVLRELAALEHTQVAAVARAGVTRLLLGELGKVGAAEDLAAQHLRAQPRALPPRLVRRLRQDEDVARV